MAKGKAEKEDPDAKYNQWKRLLPVLYDSFTNHNLVWPSLSCRWGPRVEDLTFKVRQRAYLSEQTDGSVPNTLVVANVEVLRPHIADSESMQSFNYDARSPLVRKYKTIIHPGEVNRIREYPKAQHIVATHSDVPQVYVWNVDTQPERKEDAKEQGSSASKPDLELTGHEGLAEFALAFHAEEPRLISGGRDGEVLLWHLDDHVTSLARAAPSQKEASSGRKSINSGGGGEAPGMSTQVKERGRFKGHSDTIEDVTFRPGNADEFCSVGDDKKLVFWDARQGGDTPAAAVASAHNDDIHTVDWNSHDENLVITGSADTTVRLFDRRKLTKDGKEAVVHTFAAHKDAILNVQWCPHQGSVFASGGEDGVVVVWDAAKAQGEQNGSAKKKPPPELIFQHTGHKDKVVDFQWNPYDPWTILSVSDETNQVNGGGTLQIWRINDLVYLPEEEALGELKRHKDYITGKSSRVADKASERTAEEVPPKDGAEAQAKPPAESAEEHNEALLKSEASGGEKEAAEREGNESRAQKVTTAGEGGTVKADSGDEEREAAQGAKEREKAEGEGTREAEQGEGNLEGDPKTEDKAREAAEAMETDKEEAADDEREMEQVEVQGSEPKTSVENPRQEERPESVDDLNKATNGEPSIVRSLDQKATPEADVEMTEAQEMMDNAKEQRSAEAAPDVPTR